MHNFKLIKLFLLLLTLISTSSLFAAEEFLRPEEAFRISGRALDQETIQVQWQIADGYYMYKSKISFRSDTNGIETGGAEMPKAEIKHDEFFGDVEVYRNKVVATLPILRKNSAEETLTLIAKSQGCAESGLCYPPHTQTILLKLPQVAAAEPEKVETIGSNPFEELDSLSGDSAGDDLIPAEEAFKFSAEVASGDKLKLSWKVADGTYLYQEKIKLSLKPIDDVALGEIKLPKAKIKHNSIRPDGTEGDVAVYDKDFAIEVPLKRGKADALSITLNAAYQGCAEIGICYPPQKSSISLDLPAVEAIAATEKPASETPAKSEPAQAVAQQAVSTPAADEPVAEQDQIANMLKGGDTFWIILSFFGIGLLLAFTPCVFPMIPILSGIIAGQGTEITTRKAFMLSLIYVLAMAVTYTVAGVLAGLFGENLQAAFQNPWILISFAIVFVLLALSMFGFYELQLPSSLQSKLGDVSNKQKGGTYTGVAVMGFLSALIVGPCVAPPLAGALIYIGQTGDAVLGGLALFAMSMGMGAPLIALGTGAGKLLPRAGAWMEAVKAVFGILMLAVAILLLERVVSPAIAMLLWGLLLITSGVYMGALDQIADGASGWRKLWKGLGLATVIYGALMLIGVAADGKDTLQPLRGVALSGASAGSGGEQAHIEFKRIKSVDDLKREIAAASQQGKPVMLDFYADWCTYCIQFEKYVFTDAKVQSTLSSAVLLQADVTANDEQDKALLSHLGLIAPPAILFWDISGTEKKNYRVLGYMKADEFNSHARNAIK